ncbi:MAG: hypothetical protein HY319_27725 [Armatimonadetes bacterium]|nr:hypothetical protein [Armatimonadota bacterium]
MEWRDRRGGPLVVDDDASIDVTVGHPPPGNLANHHSVAFKRTTVEFRPQHGFAVRRCLDQGWLQATGNPFDIVIYGVGFFRVRLDDGSEA